MLFEDYETSVQFNTHTILNMYYDVQFTIVSTVIEFILL